MQPLLFGHTDAMQRLPSVQFEPVLQKRLEELWGQPVNLYRALGNNPALTAAWTEFANAIRHHSRTPRALRELMILRTAQMAHSEYEWAHHLRMARKSGVSESKIAALADWRASGEFDAQERAALALTEAVMVCDVSDAVHAEVKRHFSDAEFVELSLTAGFYAMVSRLLEAMRVDLDDDVRDYSPPLP
ncbi:MAG: carboxymuconolactone decarboxylase family protein [Betaproteobacteria bacterium]|nr:carboxymuconolactone decarboxylase family protein [Betaproteobacteria bacterium]